MLRVIASRSAKEYYAESLKREDYYTEGQEIRGEWQGIGAERLGLSGAADQAGFDALCENKRPGTDERLTQRNKGNRIVGYDFNFHCPKSVSVVYEFTRDERILDAFKQSVNQTMREIESEIKTRVRQKGANENRTTGNMVWAEFIHFTARPVKGLPDPHLHAHCYAFNTTWDDAEKKWKAGQFRDLKADAPYFEAAFHARFARQLAEVGYRIERTAKGWELAGVPQRVLEEFSRRTEQVEQKAKELGITSAREKDGLAALTRERKQKQLSKMELRELWDKRISANERAAIQNSIGHSHPAAQKISEMKAMDYAIQHCYERVSIVTDKELLRHALRHGVGDVNIEQVKRQLLRDEFIKENVDGHRWFTTNQVLVEEKRLIDFVQCGLGKFKPFLSGAYQFRNETLSDEQRSAVLHVLRSEDRVTAIRGGAGTGKTTMMKQAVAAIELTGRKVFAFAPSAEASRGVLRSEAGFANAETVEALLQNPKLQEQVRGQVVWIDEAGLLGSRTLARVAALAEKQDCRIVLSGDTAQHRAVERGDALRLLEKYAGLQAAELKEIWRQKADSHKAIVAELRAGDLEPAFKQLEKLGMLRELEPEQRHETLAADYVSAVKKGKSALVISPTHAEGERVTAQIRERLKQAGVLRGNEREFIQLKNLQWTEAQRANTRSYQTGLVVQFHQNAAGFRRGERVTVTSQDEQGRVRVKHQSEETALLPLDQATRFQVYEPRSIALAAGDLIRITQNGFTKMKQRLNNGDLKKVEGFTKDGDLKLANGWVVSKDFGHWTHGYCLTSYSSQSKSVDCVFIAESSESFRAADREQFYVSASRFKEAWTIYTDDKHELLRAVSKTSERPSATDLMVKQSPETTGAGDSQKAPAQRQSADKEDQSRSESQARRRETVLVRRRHLVDRSVRQSQSKGITR
ncbi:MAG: conjugal transfer protein [Verrucomicrobia bacterium]|nr:MAG: conjugal transfer protein [Verrucomicrobiota bacterium]